MYNNCVFLILYFLGKFVACRDQKNIDSYDYDDSRRRCIKIWPPLSSKETIVTEEVPLKTYEPREDPKLFYQTQSYLKEANEKDFNKEVAYVYPGRELILAFENKSIPKNLLKNGKVLKHISSLSSTLCIRCPNDRTLIAKRGVDRVVLQKPKLSTCSGNEAPNIVRFVQIYGSKFGTLIQHGSHVIVGRIMHRNKTLQLCKMQVHVIIQSCLTPKYLISNCDDKTNICTFKCREKSLEIIGNTELTCGEDSQWHGNLPVCRARTWCPPPIPVDNGKISCRGTRAGRNIGLVEGSRCRLRCSQGWRWDKAIAVCRRGSWTNKLKCIPKRKKTF